MEKNKCIINVKTHHGHHYVPGLGHPQAVQHDNLGDKQASCQSLDPPVSASVCSLDFYPTDLRLLVVRGKGAESDQVPRGPVGPEAG